MIADLCNHRVLIYRPVVTRNQWGDAVEGWTLRSWPCGGMNARPDQAWSGDLQNPGAGETQGMRRRWFLLPDTPAQERDVLRVVEGPEAGAVLRIVSVTPTTDPVTVHHFEVNVEPTTAELPAEVGW